MKTAETTLKRQIWDIFRTHLYVIIISVIFGLGAFWWFLARPVWSRVYSIIFMAVYFFALYAKGRKTAVHDGKGYAVTKSYPAKGFVLGAVIAASTFLLWIGYRLVWKASGGVSLSGVFPSVYNGFFIFYTFIYNGIMSPYRGGFFWYAHVIMYTLPVAAVGLGYIAGYCHIDIYEKLLPFVYEKKDGE